MPIRAYGDRVDEYRQLSKDGEVECLHRRWGFQPDPHLDFAESIKPDEALPSLDRADVDALRARAKVIR